ncbi:nitrate reductase gamma subunit [Phytomonospora endophytica]|uniref:Nitrate reductase-like protein NarX n=1 Tax=Phytomonospora endophytica TaxID=714109 RepID=A0A841FMQ3_9ACTN|nr:nitrate reductase gamma subunit [Phytomonospora endophytica]GIG65457.1 hypothetical protein Pen01_17520 [Phytomonospora endophytica]
MNAVDVLLWGIAPYVVVAVLVGGTIWRYRYDKFGWTTRSSELYESRLLRIGSPLFHFGLLVVIVGHVIGLVIPQGLTDSMGLSEHAYHVQALALGGVAGVCTLAGVAILVYRRRTTGPVFRATTWNDKGMYVVLVAALLAGLATTLLGAAGDSQGNYRETVSPWFRSLFVLQPEVTVMAEAGPAFHVHTLIGMALFAIWPFTRLVHAFTAPVAYLFRPYVVYRSRDARPGASARPVRRGWELTHRRHHHGRPVRAHLGARLGLGHVVAHRDDRVGAARARLLDEAFHRLVPGLHEGLRQALEFAADEGLQSGADLAADVS